MASTGLNFTALTPDNGAIRDLKGLILLRMLDPDTLGKLFTVLPNQRDGAKVGIVGEFGLVGQAAQGCSPTYNSSAISTAEKTWNIAEWGVYEQICYEDLKGTLAQVAFSQKTSVGDLTASQYMDEVVAPRLLLAIRKMLLRFAFFGDTAAALDSAGGVLKAGVDPSYFNLTDGYWKQILAGVAGGTIGRTTFAANAQTTFATQKSTIAGKGVATGYMNSLIEDAPVALRQAENQRIYITLALKDALDADIRANNVGSDLQWESIFGGIKRAEYNGIELIVVPFMDEIIKGYEGDGKAWNNPFRAIYTTKDNLLVGIGSEDEIAELKVWFDDKEDLNYIKAKDSVGFIVASDDLVQVGF